MNVNDYEIPEGWESMSCYHNCGFLIAWQLGSPEGRHAGDVMEGHLAGHDAKKLTIWDIIRYGRGKDNGF
jgi:hypothetical protein